MVEATEAPWWVGVQDDGSSRTMHGPAQVDREQDASRWLGPDILGPFASEQEAWDAGLDFIFDGSRPEMPAGI